MEAGGDKTESQLAEGKHTFLKKVDESLSALEAVFFAAKSAPYCMRYSRGEGGECHRKRKPQFFRGQRDCSQYRAADVGEHQLHGGNRADYQHKCRVFAESREDIDPIAPRIEAIKESEEDKKGEKSRQKAHVARAFGKMSRDSFAT